MKGTTTALAFVWLVMTCCWGMEGKGQPFVTAYSAHMFDPNSKAWTVEQAPDGRLYFGTDSVLEFDGIHWRNHPVPDAKFVRALAFDASGRLWVGAYGEVGYFEPERGGLGTYVSLTSLLPKLNQELGNVWHVFPEGAGAIFVSDNHVLSYDGQTFRAWQFDVSPRMCAWRTDGTVYLSGLRQGLLVMRPQGPERLLPPAALGNAVVFWAESLDGGLLLAASNGLYRYKTGNLSPIASPLSDILPKAVASAAVRLPDGNLAIGTTNEGIILVSPSGEIVRKLSTADGLPTREVSSLIVDRAGTVWVANGSYIYSIDLSSNTTLFGAQTGLTGKDLSALVLTGDTLSVATDEGLFVSNPGGRFAPSLSTGRYRDLVTTPEGLLGCRKGGVDLLAGDSTVRIYKTPRLVSEIIPSALHPSWWYVRSADDLLLLSRGDDDSFAIESLAPLAGPARGFSEAPDGSLWFGSYYDGATVLRLGSERQGFPYSFITVKGLPAKTGATLTTRVGSRMVVLTQRGLYVSTDDGASVQPLSGLENFRFSAVSKTSPAGDVWLAGGTWNADAAPAPFLVRLSPSANGAIRVEPFEIENLSRIGMALSLLFDDRTPATLWIGGNEGLLEVDVTRLTAPLAPATPLLTDVQARYGDGTLLPFPTKIPFSANRLTFAHSSTEYLRTGSLRFEARLADMDSAWAPVAGAAPREYLSLHEGDYRFQVRALSPVGLASDPAEWRFTVLPPWYRTWPAYVGYAALVGLTVLCGAQYRVRTVRRRNRELERLVRQRTTQLEQANAAKTQFVARINHDIRNPINGVLGLSLALADTSLTPRQRKLTASLQQCARFLASLVDEVLDLAQLESSRDAPLKAESFDLAGAITAAQATAQAQADELGCRIAVDLDPKLPLRVVGDSVRLQRIIVNFLSNAVKYGGGPTVELSARIQQHDDRRAVVRISVRDFGPGIDDEEQGRLFNQFYRGHHAHDRNIKGSGLGLAVCRLLAESMGGTVGVESALGHGSLFQVTLPLAVDHEPVALGGTSSAAPIRVLVVEDEEYNAIATTAILRRLGCLVTLARDGREALALLRAHRFTVAFLDWDLPLLDGGEVARQFRAGEPADHHTLLIATTAFATEDQRQACRAAGMDGFVAKPLTPERIAEALRGSGDGLQVAAPIHADPPADTPAPAQAPKEEFNLSLLKLLADGSEEELAKRMRQFLESCENQLRLAHQGIDAGDCIAVRNAAHLLLSHASFIDAERIIATLMILQKAAESGDKTLLPDLLTTTEAEYRHLSSKLAAILASLQSAPPQTPTQSE